MKQKSLTTECFVIKSVNRKDNDKLYTLFSRDLGKIVAVGKGVRSIKSRRAGNLDSLNLVKAKLSNRNDFYYVDEVALINSYSKIKANLETLSEVFKILEILLKLSEEDMYVQKTFGLVKRSLNFIEKHGEPAVSAQILVNFILLLLREQGYNLDFDTCSNCGEAVDSVAVGYRFIHSRGGLLCSKCVGFGVTLAPETLILLQHISRDKLYSKVSKEGLFEAENLLVSYLRDVLDIKIRTSMIYSTHG